MNFSFWPFLWFGLPGWLLIESAMNVLPTALPKSLRPLSHSRSLFVPSKESSGGKGQEGQGEKGRRAEQGRKKGAHQARGTMQRGASNDLLDGDSGGKDEDDDHDQDPLPKDLLHIRSWSSENMLLRRRGAMTMTTIASRKPLLTMSCGHGHLNIPFHQGATLGWPRSTVEKGPQSNQSYEREHPSKPYLLRAFQPYSGCTKSFPKVLSAKRFQATKAMRAKRAVTMKFPMRRFARRFCTKIHIPWNFVETHLHNRRKQHQKQIQQIYHVTTVLPGNLKRSIENHLDTQ